nr:polymorphic toxin type 28 domain-containing protein [Pseudomonas phytophila]
MEDFVGDMQACKTDACYRNTWTAQYGDSNYNQRSLDNLKDALETVGPARAGALLGEIRGGLAALGELQCSSAVCDNYKFTLIDRALTARESLEQTYLEGGGIIGGLLLGPVGAIGGAVRGATAAETNSIQKAYTYWVGVRGAKEAGSSATKLSQGEQKAVARIDNIIKNFKDHDIEGTLKDMAGDPVLRKNGSGYYDHLNEMQERIRGLTNHAETLKNVSNPEAQAARQAALDTLKRISDSLNGAGI